MSTKKLWYTKEASEWTQALPLGNGHMGAMCYGGASGRYDLSENTCWSGKEESKPLQENAAACMEQAREALIQRQYGKAEALLENCTGVKKNYGTQVPMGRLTVGVEESPLHVRRELDLEAGIAAEELEFAARTVKRESFLSNPDKIMGVRMHCEKGLPVCCIWTEGWSQPSNTKWDPQGKMLRVQGRALENIHSDGLSGVSYWVLLHYETDGAVSWNRRGLVIEGASEVTVWLAASTDMFEKNPAAVCRCRVLDAAKKGWETVCADHIRAHRAGMGTCTFELPDVRAGLPTDERIRAFAENGGDDGGLVSLFFEYGRYLLFCSSRKDSALPAALQGVWNDDRACRMEWTDDMHLDINTQMNYYPAENTGLGDCMAPLFLWIKDVLVPHGRKIAGQLYGKKGWCAHTVSNAWGWAAPGWDVGWGLTVSAGGWAAYQIWEHYLFTKDRTFLEEYFDVLYENAEFLAGILMEDPETGMLLTVPSYSPENSFVENGEQHNLTAGTAFDTAVARRSFQIVRRGAEILGRQDAFTDSLEHILEKLPPVQIGSRGQIMEWFWDYEEAYPDHRHTSHLLALHPFGLIDPAKEERLAEAAKTSLRLRLGENAQDIVYANWAGALLILYYARLLDGETAGEFVKPMIAFLSRENMMITHQGPTTSVTGGIYELDGNTGFTAGVAEMLVQSTGEEIRILPAVPQSWKTGKFENMRVYGGHKVCAAWDETGVSGTILLSCGGEICVSCLGQEQVFRAEKGERCPFRFERKRAALGKGEF